jgi:hypothetical protein
VHREPRAAGEDQRPLLHRGRNGGQRGSSASQGPDRAGRQAVVLDARQRPGNGRAGLRAVGHHGTITAWITASCSPTSPARRCSLAYKHKAARHLRDPIPGTVPPSRAENTPSPAYYPSSAIFSQRLRENIPIT